MGVMGGGSPLNGARWDSGGSSTCQSSFQGVPRPLPRRCKASLRRSKGPWTRPGPAVKAFDSDNTQPSSPGEAGQDQTWNQMYPLRHVFV